MDATDANDRRAWVPPPSEEHQAAHPGWDKPAEAVPDHVEGNEDAVALAFAATKAGTCLYDHTAGCWYIWQTGRWARDNRNSIFNTAREFARVIRDKINDAPTSMAKIAFAAAVERAARSDPRLAASQEVWDTDPWLLGVPGGVVDLRTGITKPSDPSLYISRQTSVAPAPPGTPAPIWTKFLADATGGDEKLQAFLQRLAGYMLTGQVNEEVLSFFYGDGGNGKGVFLGAIAAVMAEYAVSVPIEVFTAGSRLNVEYYRAQMAGARLVTASETETQATWAEAQIKEMTGNENPLPARHPYGHPFNFWPQFKIALVGNHAPKLKGRTPAMERRLRILPFDNKPAEPDLGLKEKLRAEHPAILAWAIAGCLAWQADGLGTAPAVTAATAAYFEQQDGFKRWIEECCVLDPKRSVKSSVLFAAFNAWTRDNGEEPVTGNTFAELIDRTKGLSRRRSRDGRMVDGIGFAAPEEAPQTPP